MIIGVIYLLSYLLLFWFFLLSTLALHICAENSFWHKNSLFLDAFSDALQLYDSSGTRKRVESRLNQLGSYPQDTKGKHLVLQYFQSKSQDVRQEKYKAALTDLVLAHCLGISTFFYLSLSHIIDSQTHNQIIHTVVLVHRNPIMNPLYHSQIHTF